MSLNLNIVENRLLDLKIMQNSIWGKQEEFSYLGAILKRVFTRGNKTEINSSFKNFEVFSSSLHYP